MKTIGRINNEERKVILEIEKGLDSLGMVQASMGNTDLLDDEFEKLKEIVAKDEKELFSQKEFWWINVCEKYDLEKERIPEYLLFFDTNEICINN